MFTVAMLNRPLIILFALAALTSATFFQGINGELLVVTECLLLGIAFIIAWQGYAKGFGFPHGFLPAAISLYWGWLILSLAWSPVPAVSAFLIWWAGTLPLAFWLYTLLPDHMQIWRQAATGGLLLALVLAGAGIYQLLVLHESPRVMFININSYAGLLNIITIPAASYFLIRFARAPRAPITVALGGVLFVLIYALGITRGRGALLAFLLSMAILFLFSFRHLPLRALGLLAVLILVALGLANVSWHGGMFERMHTLADPMNAGWTRFLIWQGSWELLKESPWFGIGLGIYSLAWPPYRHLNDSTAGYFVHNDYLQLWIEAGLPGLLLFLAIFAAAAWMMIRVWRGNVTAVTRGQRVELTGLAAGVFAVAFHSLFDFNFWVVPTLILCGVMLGRLQKLAAPGLGAWRFEPRRLVSRPTYLLIVGLLFLFPLVYFVTLTLSVYETRRAVELVKEGKIDEAEASLFRATRFYPYADNTLMSHADLYRHALTLLPSSATENRRVLFERTNELLDDALKLNPLRVQTYVVRAQLYEQNRELAGKEWLALTRSQYDHALQLNPRHFEARFLYARLLNSMRESERARKILETGLRYSHIPHAGLLPYYMLAADLRTQHGDLKGAEEMRQQIKDILDTMNKTAPVLNSATGTGTP
jgi:O-antigen ligase